MSALIECRRKDLFSKQEKRKTNTHTHGLSNQHFRITVILVGIRGRKFSTSHFDERIYVAKRNKTRFIIESTHFHWELIVVGFHRFESDRRDLLVSDCRSRPRTVLRYRRSLRSFDCRTEAQHVSSHVEGDVEDLAGLDSNADGTI